MSEDNTELEDLETLLASPGWARLVAFANREWSSEQYRQRVQRALDTVPSPDKAGDAAILIMRLEDTAKAVDNVLAWPAFRLRQLRQAGGRRGATAR
jgi:hypothetical protein